MTWFSAPTGFLGDGTGWAMAPPLLARRLLAGNAVLVAAGWRLRTRGREQHANLGPRWTAVEDRPRDATTRTRAVDVAVAVIRGR